MGANVLIVAPSSTSQVDIATNASDDLDAGLVTTDLTGDDGLNAAPTTFPVVQEPNGDYFADTDYASTFGGTEAAAAEVTGVIALMLEANPNLSRRDVEQILLMSAAQNDQFSETWVINQYSYFQDPFQTNFVTATDENPLGTNPYARPFYNRYSLDTNADGQPDIQNGVLPDSPLLTNVFNPFTSKSFFGSQGSLEIEDLLSLVGRTDRSSLVLSGPNQPGQEVYLFGLDGDNNLGNFTLDDLFAPADYTEIPLLYENGVGYTVSQGYGQYLEGIGYAHGLLDAGLAVELAAAWSDLGLTNSESVSVSTAIDASSVLLTAQAASTVDVPNTPLDMVIPGGVGFGAPDTFNVAFYNQFLLPYTTTEVNVNGVALGEVITGGPFVDPNLNLPVYQRASSYIPIEFDEAVDVDFLSVEWIEVNLGIDSGDVDNLRLSILSPDGTQSELSQYVMATAAPTVQKGQFSQGVPVAEGIQEIVDEFVGSPVFTDFSDDEYQILNPDVIDGSEEFFLGTVDGADPIPAATEWTFTTNRHYGEILSTRANNLDDPTFTDDEWFLVVENYGGVVEIDGLQITFHGSDATNTRIQGKVGVDDNAQSIDDYNLPTVAGGSTATNPTPEQLGDGIFNFDRHVEFGEVVVDPTPSFDPNGFYYLDGDEQIVTVVLDDRGDSVHFDEFTSEVGGVQIDNAYRTVDPDTGIERVYPVVDRAAYFDYDTDPTALGTLVNDLSQFDDGFTNLYVNPWLRKSDGQFTGNGGLLPDLGLFNDLGIVTFQQFHRDGTIASYTNFDYSQESFASGEVIQATQYIVTYDEFGVAADRVATGEVQTFVTGADGNYYFDVESTPAPPSPWAEPAAYGNWLQDFGFTYEYEVSIVDQSDRLFDRAYTLDEQEDPGSQVSYAGNGVYNVQVFASQNEDLLGETIKVKDVNFLLAVDLAEVQVNVAGTVVRDVDGDGVQDVTDGAYSGVTVFVDLNGNNAIDANEPTAVTAADGTYALSFDPDGSTSASIRLDDSTYTEPLRPVTPVDGAGAAELELTGFEGGDNVVGDFFLKPIAAVVTGTVWQDTDEDGDIDPTESALDGTAIGIDGVNPAVFAYIDVNNNGSFDAADEVSPVDASGNFQFEFDTAGSVVIRLDLSNADLSQTFPFGGAAQIILLAFNGLGDLGLAPGTSAPVFGVKDQRVFDYGDLPDSYGTTLASDGARHRVNNGALYLGTTAPDTELNGQQSVNADGDDNLGVNDEDGVRLLDATVNGTTGVVEELVLEIVVNGGGGLLNVFIDFNNNGVFDASDHVAVDVANLATGISTPVSITAPAGTVFADRYATRVRYGPAGVGPTGEANEGEVEDLWIIPSAIDVSGRILQDADNNGVFDDAFDTSVSGVRVFLDTNLNGVRDVSEPSSLTDAAGFYAFQAVAPPPGQTTELTIRVDASTLPSGTTFLSPADGIVSELASGTPGAEPNNTVTANFLTAPTNRPIQSIAGAVLMDPNADPGVSPTAPGAAGIEVQLLTNLDTDPELEVLATTLTDADGAYSFVVENTGDYEVAILLPTGGVDLEQTTPNPSTNAGRLAVTLGVGDDAVLTDFAVFDRRATYTSDFGDLPASYDANGAASHLVQGPDSSEPVYLGSTVDTDSGVQSSSAADGDDLNFTDDEDGVELASLVLPVDNGGSITPGTIELDVTATGTPDSRLNVWVDLDGNGIFEPGEQIVTDLALSSGATTRVVRSTTDLGLLSVGELAVRARWGTPGVGPIGSTGFGGAQAVGEVEDNLFSVADALSQSAAAIMAAESDAPTRGRATGTRSAFNRVDVAPESFDATAFGATTALRPRFVAARDESLAVDSPSTRDAIDDALLLWSVGPQAPNDAAPAADGPALEDESAADSEADLAFAEVFGL